MAIVAISLLVIFFSISFMLTDYKIDKLEEKIDELLKEKKGE